MNKYIISQAARITKYIKRTRDSLFQTLLLFSAIEKVNCQKITKNALTEKSDSYCFERFRVACLLKKFKMIPYKISTCLCSFGKMLMKCSEILTSETHSCFLQEICRGDGHGIRDQHVSKVRYAFHLHIATSGMKFLNKKVN